MCVQILSEKAPASCSLDIYREGLFCFRVKLCAIVKMNAHRLSSSTRDEKCTSRVVAFGSTFALPYHKRQISSPFLIWVASDQLLGLVRMLTLEHRAALLVLGITFMLLAADVQLCPRLCCHRPLWHNTQYRTNVQYPKTQVLPL